MAYFSIKQTELNQAAGQLDMVHRQLSKIQSEALKISYSLHVNSAQGRVLSGKIKTLSEAVINTEMRNVNHMSQGMRCIVDQYAKAEKRACAKSTMKTGNTSPSDRGALKDLKDILRKLQFCTYFPPKSGGCSPYWLGKIINPVIPGTGVFSVIPSGIWNKLADHTTHGENSKVNESDDMFFSAIKTALKWADKTGASNTAGVAGDGISYAESAKQFFSGDMKGLTGAKNWFDLGDKSIGLWNGFYGYLKKFYNETGNAFSKANQTKAAGLGIVGSTLGLISSACGAYDTISQDDNMGAAGKIGQAFIVSKDAVDIWGDIKKLENVGNTAKNITTSKGVYSPLTFYTTIAKSYLDTFAQGFSSYEKYYADGAWDLGDTARTGIEASVAGLYSMANSLSFGLVSDKTIGVSAEDVSNFFENGAKNIGENAGKYILNDAKLYKAYQDTNAAGRVLLTFYAAFKSI